jgi:glutamate dehydrogenase
MATATGNRQDTPDQQLITDLSQALIRGALPGELDDFDEKGRAEAASFVAEAAARRAPGRPSLKLESVGRCCAGSSTRTSPS